MTQTYAILISIVQIIQMQQLVTQKEFLESYKDGRKEFSGVLMQFFELSDIKLSGLTIKDSKIAFCTFRNCEMRDVSLEKCEIYFGSFYAGEMIGTVFDSCKIEVTLFDAVQFKNTSLKNCSLVWNGILNSNLPDLSMCSQFRTITDLSQLTPSDIEEVIRNTMRDIERLDVGTRLKIKEMIRQDLDRYDIRSPADTPDRYKDKQRYDNDAPLTYSEVKGVVESLFSYSDTGIYKTKKHAYQTSGIYKPRNYPARGPARRLVAW